VKMEAPRNEAVLRPDFAHRVIARVRKAKHRRQLYRRALASAIAGALGIVAILYFRSRNLPPQPSTLLASRNASRSEWMILPMEVGGAPEFDSRSPGQPLTFFFPGATAVADFQSSEATYWHSYDPWWNPSP
jgi:hypothetical protein